MVSGRGLAADVLGGAQGETQILLERQIIPHDHWDL